MATTGEDCAIKLMSTKLCSKWTKEIHVTYESTSIASRKQNYLTQRKSNNWNVWNVCISVGNNVVNDSWMVKNNVKKGRRSKNTACFEKETPTNICNGSSTASNGSNLQ